MNSQIVRAVASIVTSLLALGFTSSGKAYEATSCEGQINKGLRSAVTFQINRCSIPVGSVAESDIINAFQAWNKIHGMWDRFSWTGGTSACSSTLGNGVFEIGLANRADIGGDDTNGLTKKRVRDCDGFGVIQDGRLLEADVFIANSGLATGATSVVSESQPARRGTTLHELGHVLGMDHENDVMSLMRSSAGANSTHGKYGGTEADRNAPHPDDVAFGFAWHGSGSDSVDFAASGFWWTGGHRRLTHTSSTIQEVCPGSSVFYRFSYANRGKSAPTSTNNVPLRIVISANETISTSDQTVANWTVWPGQQGFGTASSNFTVPSGLVNGQVYWVGAIIDPTNIWTGEYANNNEARLNLRIRFRSIC